MHIPFSIQDATPVGVRALEIGIAIILSIAAIRSFKPNY